MKIKVGSSSYTAILARHEYKKIQEKNKQDRSSLAYLGSLVPTRNMTTKQQPMKIETYAIIRYCTSETASITCLMEVLKREKPSKIIIPDAQYLNVFLP